MGRPLVYRALELLEARGLIEAVGSEPGARGPNRALFQATERGRDGARPLARASRSTTSATSGRSCC